MKRIVSKVHRYGSEHESEWPSKYGTLDTTPMYIDPVTKEVKPGYPPRPEKFGEAPLVKFDSMRRPEYHESAGRMVDSWQEWERLDKETGQLSFGTVEESRRNIGKGVKEERKALAKDRRQAAETALRAYKANPKEVSQKVAKKAEEQREIAEKSGLSKLIDEAI